MSRFHPARVSGVALAFTILAVVIMAVPMPASASSVATLSVSMLPGGSSPPCSGAACPVPVNFTLAPGNQSINISSTFWGTTISPRARMLPGEASLINATPTQIIVFPGANAGEHYDPLTNVFYNARTGLVETGHPQVGINQFITFCKSIHCQAILQVPGEINSPSVAAEIVRNVTVNDSFQPAYWEIGNEPELWTCWTPQGIPWGDQTPTNCTPKHLQTETPTPEQYAWEVHNYTIAMRAVDPGIKFIGIPATGRANGPYQLWDWIRWTVLVNGPNLTAVAFHEYPVSKTKTSITDFYGAITSSSTASLPWRMANTTQAILNATYPLVPSSSCSLACARNIKIFVTEIGSGLSNGQNKGLIAQFPGALNLAAQMTQAMDLNISNLDLFAAVLGTANSWFNFTGAVRPDYAMYSSILNHLGPEAFPVHFSTAHADCLNNLSMCQNLYGIGTLDPGQNDRSDLLLINVNATINATFDASELKLPGPGGTVIPATNHPLEIWTWNANYSYDLNLSATPSPVARYFPNGLLAPLTLANQSVALIETYPQGGVPVQFTETGFTPTLTLGPRWYLTFGGLFEEANATTNMTYFEPPGEYALSGIPIPLPLDGIERVYKLRLEPFVPSDIYVGTGPVNVTVPFVEQSNVSISIAGNESLTSGYVSPSPGWWNTSTPLTVTAHPGFGDVLRDWVEDENWTGTESNSVISFNNSSLGIAGAHETNNTSEEWTNVTSERYTNITGDSPSLSVWVNDSVNLTAVFVPGYPVTFVENGLAPGTQWSVAVRSDWNDSSTTYRDFDNFTASVNWKIGHYGHPYQPPFTVGNWTNNTVTSRRTEAVTDSVPTSSVTSDLGLEEANGTYGFTVANVPGYRSLPVGANFTVAGGRVIVVINFTPTTPPPPEYPVTFVESGLPAGTPWSITVRNVTVDSNGTSLEFQEAAGAYGYVARTIVGYGGHPPSSGFNVNNSSTVVSIIFGQELYPVIWEESGLGNVSWTVDLSGDPIVSNGAWATDPLPNGTYAYTIPDVGGYVPELSSGTVTVNGVGQVFTVQFIPATYSVTFVVSGGPAGAPWSVRFGDSLLAETTGPARFFEPNGTYSYDVTPPAGYTAVPSHGVLTVGGSATVVSIDLQLIGLAPVPSVWSLGLPALGVAVVIAAAGWGTFALVGARRRRRPGAKP